MKIQIKNILLLCCIISSLISTAQDRNVIWVHGFVGTQDSWEVYDESYAGQQQTGSRKMTGFRVGYNDDANNNGTPDYFDGFANAAYNIDHDIDSSLGSTAATHPQNIAVCHSLGGLVTRQLQRERELTNKSPFFGGFITVGSPNQGASLANAAANGNLDNYINHGINEMTAPFSTSIPFIGTGILIQSIDVTLIASLMKDEFVSLLHNGNMNATVTDLSKGSNAINVLNNYNTSLSMPRIAIQTYETTPVHWRALSSIMTSKNGITSMDDTKVVHIMQIARGLYNAYRIINNIRAVTLGIVGIINPPTLALSAFFALKAIQWHRGVVWMDNSESMWNALLDCQEVVNTTVTTTTFNAPRICDFDFPNGGANWQNCVETLCALPAFNCFTTTTTTTQTIVKYKNDGIVCQNDMRLDGVCDVLTPGRGVNHFEQRNTQNGTTENGNDEMDRLFTDIWDGNGLSSGCDFFETDER